MWSSVPRPAQPRRRKSAAGYPTSRTIGFDLASGYANVVVLSPLGGRSGPLPAGQFEGLRRSPEWGTDLPSQVEALRKQGSRVEVITPDADSRAAMGTNQMDPATRIPAARAGFAQGRQEAARVTLL
jgi:NTE family protein